MPQTTSSQNGDDGRQPSPPPRIKGPLFPLSYKEAASQWWSNVTADTAERKVLGLMSHIKEDSGVDPTHDESNHTDPYGKRVWRRSMVKLSGKNRALNELSITRVGEEIEQTLVIIHGYGAGLGFFYKNFEPVSRIRGLKVYALDWLGMGNSSRPPFKVQATKKEERAIEAENWFIDALEEWRIARNIGKFILLGHSLGGYLSVSYALKYPGHLQKLILASPVGIPEDPYAVNESLPEPMESTLYREFSKDQESAEVTTNYANTKKAQGETKKPLPNWLVCLWDANVSPFSFIRMTGPLGPKLVSGWTSRRFDHVPPKDSEALHDYSYSIFRQKGSGEYALPYILAPGAYARRPIIRRIQEVGRQSFQSENGGHEAETGIPIIFMYGDHDWMDAAAGLAAQAKVNEANLEASQNNTNQQDGNKRGEARYFIIKDAGHHLYLDNADDFNAILCKEVEETRLL